MCHLHNTFSLVMNKLALQKGTILAFWSGRKMKIPQLDWTLAHGLKRHSSQYGWLLLMKTGEFCLTLTRISWRPTVLKTGQNGKYLLLFLSFCRFHLYYFSNAVVKENKDTILNIDTRGKKLDKNIIDIEDLMKMKTLWRNLFEQSKYISVSQTLFHFDTYK